MAICAVAVVLIEIPASPAKADHIRQKEAVFKPKCEYSHSLADDPIVLPDQPGASHLHDFFGNTGTNASSVPYTLRNSGETTCDDPLDKAAYWTPAILNDGTHVKPRVVDAYYQVFPSHTSEGIEAFPYNFRMVFGDSNARKPQGWRFLWQCRGKDTSGRSVRIDADTPPTCPDGSHLAIRILSPSCWDGVNHDSPDHKSHMAYLVNGKCPATHPVPTPTIHLQVRWGDFSGDPARNFPGGPDITLASGGVYGLHADFMNGWDQPHLKERISTCLVGTQNC